MIQKMVVKSRKAKCPLNFFYLLRKDAYQNLRCLFIAMRRMSPYIFNGHLPMILCSVPEHQL